MDASRLVVQSESFSYAATDCTLVCDAGLLTGRCTAGAGYVCFDPQTERQTVAGLVQLPDTCSVSKAEHAAVLVGLAEAAARGVRVPTVQTDARQVVDALRTLRHTDTQSSQLESRVAQRLNTFDSWAVEHVSRDQTRKADALARRAYEQDGYAFSDSDILS